MTLATIVNRLIAEGSITRIRVNYYQVGNTARTRRLNIPEGTVLHPLSAVHQEFAVQRIDGSYTFRLTAIRPTIVSSTQTQTQNSVPIYEEPARLRTIRRDGYHSNGDGTSRRGIDEALRAIESDEDGVRRSYGLEWEIASLTPRQEDALARLLDTMPSHFTERDGSLSSTGVEIIFLPLGLQKIKEVWNKLQTFCRENDVRMDGAGAHLTYGVSNAECSQMDLQIRLNRVALTVKASSTQRNIINVFGRDFTSYASLPNSTTIRSHSNAWSASRGTSAYELRLCAWEGNIDKITEFMRVTECVFHRPFNAQDFLNIFEVMGSSTDGQ